ncbi:TIR-only protein-like [Macadamia integrifolia]|uniref:TIR-only protein-like n=1 Tax=Macadamia integrifolia TaxID=60698 RepID=UPI001C4E782A|nr:TIR-only protein-like [Macadamia integrifolia]
MDTKRNIAVLLYDRFVQLELHPFLDYRSMKPGDELLVNIETVIKYQKKIIPIFYDVNPSDLVPVDDGSYPAKELQRFRLALEHAKRRLGLPFDPSNG